jgi:hypothetical protein
MKGTRLDHCGRKGLKGEFRSVQKDQAEPSSSINRCTKLTISIRPYSGIDKYNSTRSVLTQEIYASNFGASEIMLIFFDESFRESLRYGERPFGVLCGIGIAEKQIGRVASDVYQLKAQHLGVEFARDGEIKGKEIFKNYVFRLAATGIPSKNLALGDDLLDYLRRKRLPVFGCVCFEKKYQKFQVDDVTALDKTFRYLFERVDTWMKIHLPNEKALLVFDDRDYGINRKNAEAISNFFQRSPAGLELDSIVQTPFFAISQSQNVGLQLADLITTVVGLRFASHASADPYFAKLKECIPYYENNGQKVSCLKVLRNP